MLLNITKYDPVVADEIAYDDSHKWMSAKESYEFELEQIEQALYEGESKTGLSGADILDDIAGTLEAVDIRGLICAQSEKELLYNAKELQEQWISKARSLMR
jgi:hypothetical protein